MEQSLKRLINKIKKYAPNSDFKLLEKAYNLSQRAHEKQIRESGEPFITHPMGVAHILEELELDCTSIIAGILHDTVEDTTFTMKELKQEFGEEIANLINGVTKLRKIPYSTKEEQQVENLRKMLLNSSLFDYLFYFRFLNECYFY